MRKIKNPYTITEGYNCFGCSPHNECGLQMQFFEEGDEIISIWEPKDHFQGYGHILHGGIQTTLLDEIASWVVFAKLKTGGVTSKIETQFKKPVYTNKGKITLKARLHEMKRNIARIYTSLYDSENNLCSEGFVDYFTFSEEVSRKRLRYPGYDAFFEK
jgi:acyl-coenzyme A thioesterase PaaI-like protein